MRSSSSNFLSSESGLFSNQYQSPISQSHDLTWSARKDVDAAVIAWVSRFNQSRVCSLCPLYSSLPRLLFLHPVLNFVLSPSILYALSYSLSLHLCNSVSLSLSLPDWFSPPRFGSVAGSEIATITAAPLHKKTAEEAYLKSAMCTPNVVFHANSSNRQCFSQCKHIRQKPWQLRMTAVGIVHVSFFPAPMSVLIDVLEKKHN